MVPEFKLPIEYTDHARVTDNLSTDLQLHGDESSLVELLYKPKSELERRHLQALATLYTTDKSFIMDTQKLLTSSEITLGTRASTMPAIGLKEGEEVSAFLSKYGYFTFSLLKGLNGFALALGAMCIYSLACPALAVALPLMLLFMPFLILKARGQRITLETYVPLVKAFLKRHALGSLFDIGSATWKRRGEIIMTAGFYAFQLYFNIENFREHIANLRVIHDRLHELREYLQDTNKRLDIVVGEWSAFSSYRGFVEQAAMAREACSKLQSDLLNVQPLSISISKALNLGTTMYEWHRINTDVTVSQLLNYCENFNAYFSNVLSLREEVKAVPLGRAAIGKRTSLKALWHPSIGSTDAIKNNMTLRKNIVLTGPNAAGKTTIAKSILYNSILAQQIGLGFYKSGRFMLTDRFHSYINIPDTNERDSLFQAEASRCKEVLDAVSSNPRATHLCIFDELFSGTNPDEAISSARAFLEHLSINPRVKFILTTHYKDLAKLSSCDTVAKHMEVKVKDGCITPTYKLTRGVSSVNGGVYVLKQAGFPEEIVERARACARS